MHLIGLIALNPALRTLDENTYVPVKQAIDIAAPRIAKPLLLSCLTATTGLLVSAAAMAQEFVAVGSAVALVALLVVLFAILRGDLPINRTMAGWSAKELPADWREVRAGWERFFAVRVTANSLALLAAGVAVYFSALDF